MTLATCRMLSHDGCRKQPDRGVISTPGGMRQTLVVYTGVACRMEPPMTICRGPQ
jgi:hypothetical protein